MITMQQNLKELDRIKVGLSGIKETPFIVEKGGYVTLTNGERMYLPKGFLFDNGSIPKLFKFLYDTFKIKFFNYLCKAFLIHDFLYKHHGYQISPRFLIRPVTRSFADDQMAYFMRVKGRTEKQIKVFFYTVRFVGWLAWNK